MASDPIPEALAKPRESLGYLTRLLFRSFTRALEVRTLQHGVSSGQWGFLRMLWQEDGITQRELSRRTGMREPTTVTAMRSLEKSGLALRVAGEDDRRKMHVFLTPKAKALAPVLAPCVLEVNALATRGMSPDEVATLRRLLTLATENLAEAEAASKADG